MNYLQVFKPAKLLNLIIAAILTREVLYVLITQLAAVLMISWQVCNCCNLLLPLLPCLAALSNWGSCVSIDCYHLSWPQLIAVLSLEKPE